MNHPSKKIAMIGTGIMGSGLAANLLKAGHGVHLYMRNPSKIHHLAKEELEILKGPRATLYDNVRDAAKGVDLVVLCLTEDEIVKKAFFTEGVLESGADHIIDTGTTSPALTLQMLFAAKEKGIHFLDAPMTGSKLAARSGQILFMVGGEKEQIDDLAYFFEPCGQKYIHCGIVSNGQRAKIALNMIQAGLFQVYLEGFQLAKKDKIPSSVFMEIVNQSAASSPLLNFKLGNVLRENYEAHFALKNMNKDIHHAMQRADELNVSLPLCSELESIYAEGMKLGFGEEDFASLAKVSEKRNSNQLADAKS
jgi:3-hydroxyisobutyrate dehydrogenase